MNAYIPMLSGMYDTGVKSIVNMLYFFICDAISFASVPFTNILSRTNSDLEIIVVINNVIINPKNTKKYLNCLPNVPIIKKYETNTNGNNLKNLIMFANISSPIIYILS